MKGNNELHLNTSTMIEAVQLWLKSEMPNDTPTVTNVKHSGQHTLLFLVSLSSSIDGEKR